MYRYISIFLFIIMLFSFNFTVSADEISSLDEWTEIKIAFDNDETIISDYDIMTILQKM